MTEDQMISQVERYFAAVDEETLETLLGLLTEDCEFTVPTHGVRLTGHAEIGGMFRRLWANHAAVKHHKFVHVPDTACGRIASRFAVENTHDDGALVHKSNCNFFTFDGNKFSAIAVYMAGPNTLDRA